MNKEELKELQEGSVIYVPYIVDYVQSEKDCVMAVLPREKGENEEARKGILPVSVFRAADIQSWEAPPRRKFQPCDFVLYDGGLDIVVSYENESRQVCLKCCLGPVDAEALTLLLSAEEVEKLVAEKGGSDD